MDGIKFYLFYINICYFVCILVFTNEISSPCPEKQLNTSYKKRTPSLFESDSDPEIDYFQIKDSIKSKYLIILFYLFLH